MDLKHQTILLTGAGRGMGVAIARACAARGARLILHYHASANAARALQDALGDAVIGCVGEDLCRSGAGARLWAGARALGEPVTALVNNAGIYSASPLNSDLDAWRQAWADNLAVNLVAAAELCHCAVQDFRTRGGGTIINIASRAGERGDDGDHDAYAAAKGGLLAQTRTLARALAGENIQCFAIAPGWVDTDMAPKEGARRAAALAGIPLGKMAQPEEIAALTAFLLSSQCPSLTGATLDVNGASYVR